ncbi:bifunctional 6-phosphofructo-2-kinase/fructose-2,6-bisphosphate 2-phosphatase [Linderina pennispora]|uniref:Bifunctional 6-phosphofructo-2-kinase/fructose-2,6-bisphosphate 2-phosphatase n=1 Tax=Linderina pennispora TaxID=61395 RepID=A0A1Y1VYD7_9FUNG|nr:bifunctional 6-phosphofructo-2-kinase/fructose-2,6-bisphosphate 2-phosphatase [Linderina pennispora]ORX66280.1 bifunctional 6-phosphofructo-2-kinase/fructose-2,6-bisphosphate 2-phosphatase [Linderina pennispora]
MVGLPARGKSYIVKKLKRYLSWLGFQTKIFNVGDRRRLAGTIEDFEPAQKRMEDEACAECETPQSADGCAGCATRHSSDFFDPDNARASQLREQVAMDVLDDLLRWLQAGGQIAIHDATNSTIARRRALIERIGGFADVNLLFAIINRNIRLKTQSPDYLGMDPAVAEADFRARLRNYERAYTTYRHVGTKVIAYNIQGFLESQVVFYLMNMNLQPRVIYITRHGESQDNAAGRIGGDACLSDTGRQYAQALARFIDRRRSEFGAEVAASNQKMGHFAGSNGSSAAPAFETAEHFDATQYRIKHIRSLNEIYAGKCEGMTYAEIAAQYPDEFEARQLDKFYYRYPGIGGESYADVVLRLQQVIVELERIRHSVLLLPLGYVYACEPRPFGNFLRVWRYVPDIDDFEEIDAASTLKIRYPEILMPDRTATPPLPSPAETTCSARNTKLL